MSPVVNHYTGMSSRKPHRKSRLGCGNCKWRRVKCDENKPVCGNCLRHSIQCDYEAIQSVPSDSSRTNSTQDEGTQPESSVSPNASSSGGYTFYSSSQSNFKPPKRGDNARASRRRNWQQEPSCSPEISSALTTRPFEFTITDMELFHHFLISEELGFAETPAMRSQLSRLGFSYHYILRLLLAFSGFHLARAHGCRESKYYSEAERHYEHAILEVSAAIPLLDNQNCQALYMAAVFIFICSFAKGPRSDEFLAFRNDAKPGFVSLLMGVRSITENCRNFLSVNVLTIHAGFTEHSSQPSPPCHSIQLSGYSAQIEQLHELIMAELAPDDCRYLDYTDVLDKLHQCFNSIYGNQLPLADRQLWPQIFGWLYTLPDVFLADLQHQKRVALVIFAFYAVLLKRLSGCWFICDWPEHIMTGIYQFVPEEYRPFIQWPMEHIKQRFF